MGFRGAARGQSEVVGAILIFAIVVAFVGMYQAFLVPQANEEVEMDHEVDVQRDVVELRAGMAEAATANEPRSRTVDLGTTYPSRFVAINPPPPTGTLRTEAGDGPIEADHDDLDLQSVCGTSGPPDTRFLTYRANYNEYGGALPVTVENTVAYRETAGDPLFSTGQMFARGTTIHVVRYVGDVDHTTSETVSVDLVPSETGATTVEAEDDPLNVTLPTRLSDRDWDRLVDSSRVTTHDVDGRDRVTFEFENETVYTVQCTTVGIDEDPDVEPRKQDTEKFDSINPASAGKIRLNRTGNIPSGSPDETEVSIWLENRSEASEPVVIESARLNYYSGTSPGSSPEGDITHVEFVDGGDTEFLVGGEFKNLDSALELDEGETEVKLRFDGEMENDDFYVLTLGFSDGNTGTYFISHSS